MAALRPVAWSTVVSAAFAVFIAAPAAADPNAVPDAGAPPVPAGVLQLPGMPPSIPNVPMTPPVEGPLAAQLTALEIEVAVLGERRNTVDAELERATTIAADREREWRDAEDTHSDLRRALAKPAGKEYKDAAGLQPFGGFGADLSDLDEFAPWIDKSDERDSPFGDSADDPDFEVTPWEVIRAEATEREAFKAHSDARLAQQAAQGMFTTVDITFKAREGALIKLRQNNVAQLAAIEAAEEAENRRLANLYQLAGANTAGQRAHPKAIETVVFARSQVGKWYEWGAEGPHTYDCSGLMWRSYKNVGVTLPRVAKDQYRGTAATPVTFDRLLPGDLIYYGTDQSDWRSIYHVAMYVGGGQMVEAPTTGKQVRIRTIRRDRYFGATRVIPAIPAPTPTNTSTTTKSPSPTPSKTTTSPTPPPTVPTSPPTGTLSPDPSPTPSPTRTSLEPEAPATTAPSAEPEAPSP